jgi:hypothetical protein
MLADLASLILPAGRRRFTAAGFGNSAPPLGTHSPVNDARAIDQDLLSLRFRIGSTTAGAMMRNRSAFGIRLMSQPR